MNVLFLLNIVSIVPVQWLEFVCRKRWQTKYDYVISRSDD